MNLGLYFQRELKIEGSPLVEKYVTDGQFTAVLSGLSDGATRAEAAAILQRFIETNQ